MDVIQTMIKYWETELFNINIKRADIEVSLSKWQNLLRRPTC